MADDAAAEAFNERLLDQMLGLVSVDQAPSPSPGVQAFDASLPGPPAGEGGGAGEMGGPQEALQGGEVREASVGAMDRFSTHITGAFSALLTLLAEGETRCRRDVETLQRRRQQQDEAFKRESLDESIAWAQDRHHQERHRVEPPPARRNPARR